MNNYQAKKQARIDRLRARSNKAKEDQRQRHSQDKHMTDLLQGQPILIGHHSEKKHRSLINKMWTNTRKGIEAGKKSEELERRAVAAENNKAISSDDPNAINKLKDKIDVVKRQSDYYKKINKIIRSTPKNEDTPEKRKQLDELGLSDRSADNLFTPDYGPPGINPYEFTNLSAERRRLEKRLSDLESRQGLESGSETVGAVAIETDLEENRIRLHFPDKPDADFRKIIKSNGFKWSPRNTAWQRFYSESALSLARTIATQYSKLSK